MRTILFSFLLFAFTNMVSAQTDNTFESLIRLGIQFHDEGEYENAIKTYKEALTIFPESKLAYYEIAFSYSLMKKYEEAIEYSLKALASPDKSSPHVDRMIYTVLGSAYDDSGQPDKAIQVYNEALEKEEDYLLYYNKALTLHRINKTDEALESYKNALKFNLNHPTSNLNVAKIYLAAGDEVSAFFYYMYFLLIEPQTDRSKEALNDLFSIGKGNIISVPDNSQQLLYLTLSLAFKSIEASDTDGNKLQLRAYDKLSTVFKLLYSVKDKIDISQLDDDICAALYAPLFYETCDNGHLETFAHYLVLSIDEESYNWLNENEEKVNTFFDWLDTFAASGTEGSDS